MDLKNLRGAIYGVIFVKSYFPEFAKIFCDYLPPALICSTPLKLLDFALLWAYNTRVGTGSERLSEN